MISELVITVASIATIALGNGHDGHQTVIGHLDNDPHQRTEQPIKDRAQRDLRR